MGSLRNAAALFLVLLSGACTGTGARIALPAGVSCETLDSPVVRPGGPRILVVVAHPDDEIAFAGALYKATTHLHGRADVAVITNGEGGYKYSTLAERVYGLPLTDEAVGRAHLPAIRRRELAAGCRWLGVSRIYFLDEQDQHYTRDEGEMLRPGADVWDLERVETALRALL
ncbi:MAG TPA: PIG-L family deacetylase, partial [Planctomycetes bacterium]|nr:PIG-L family deacetylase [Planctomycetota bacterium]